MCATLLTEKTYKHTKATAPEEPVPSFISEWKYDRKVIDYLARSANDLLSTAFLPSFTSILTR